MSWNIDIVGKKADVKAAVQAQYVPQPIKDTVALFCDAGTGPDAYGQPPEAVRVRSSGHYDARDGGSNIYYFEMNPITLAPPAPPPPEKAPAATPQPQ